MNRRHGIFVCALLLSLTSIAPAQKPANTIDASLMFSELHANAPVGGCGCFWMAGGTGELSIPIWRTFSAVAEAGGQHTDHITGFNVGLSLVSGMGGLRMRIHTHTLFQTYRQALFGGVHGFDSYFPDRVDKLPTSYDTSFAMAIGDGLDLALSHHIWVRAIQVGIVGHYPLASR